VGYVYELPTPVASSRTVKAVLGGWSFNGMVTLQSGTPFTVIGASTSNASFAQVARARTDLAPGRTVDNIEKTGSVQSRLDQYFDPMGFVNSEDRWGNEGRNILRGPSQKQVDFALAKSIRMRERFTGELRWEAFNAFNQATFSNPNSTLPAAGTGTMGAITSTIGGPRTMQVALRLKF